LELVDAAPALVSAVDGTTNAIALEDARDFQPLYGRKRETLRPEAALPPGLCEDIDTEEDLLRLAPYVGSNTRSALLVHARAMNVLRIERRLRRREARPGARRDRSAART
jgi:hypothetical protein